MEQPQQEKKEEKIKVSKKLAEQMDRVAETAVMSGMLALIWPIARALGIIEIEEEKKDASS